MTQPTITFIGGGNMARAIYGGLLDSDSCRQSLGGRPLGRGAGNASTGIEHVFDSACEALLADLIVLAIKPQITKPRCNPWRDGWGYSLVLSIVAGINAESLAPLLGLSDAGHIIRCMPYPPPSAGNELYASTEAGSAEGRHSPARHVECGAMCLG